MMGCFSLKGVLKNKNTLRLRNPNSSLRVDRFFGFGVFVKEKYTLRLRSPNSFLRVDSCGGGGGCIDQLTVLNWYTLNWYCSFYSMKSLSYFPQKIPNLINFYLFIYIDKYWYWFILRGDYVAYLFRTITMLLFRFKTNEKWAFTI